MRCRCILTITQSTYDGILYNVDMIKELLGDYIDTLHFDEAWLPHATFHDFYRGMHAIGKDRPRAKDAWCSPPSRRTSCWRV